MNRTSVGTVGAVPRSSHTPNIPVNIVPAKIRKLGINANEHEESVVVPSSIHTTTSRSGYSTEESNNTYDREEFTRKTRRKYLLSQIQSLEQVIDILLYRSRGTPGPSPPALHGSSTEVGAGSYSTVALRTHPRPRRLGRRKKALLVGVRYCPADTAEKNSRGQPKRDQQPLRELLTNQYGYSDRDIALIQDDHYTTPTRANVIAAFRELIRDAQRGDTFVLNYSGHGIQTPVRSPHRPGINVSSKIQTDNPNYDGLAEPITDDELRRHLVDNLPSGCNLTMVFDSCHCGTLLDLPPETRPWGGAPGDGFIIPQRIYKTSNTPLAECEGFEASFSPKTRRPPARLLSFWRVRRDLSQHDKLSSFGRRREVQNAGCAMAYTRSENTWKSSGAGSKILSLRSSSAWAFTSDSQERHMGSRVGEEHKGCHGSLTDAFVSALHQNPTPVIRELLSSVEHLLFMASHKTLEVIYSPDLDPNSRFEL
ncbi:hypothetical protein PHLGIDRAFT_162283 [Phlebiopsis gigantea 11061_1 CR5-6]|uniref:Peptidase C14 caspase domain-containing protein n=1 Tax=Phlebiopsis gigantea (strain 11061_1 CR5-6) TaxID=745531 RepID=A0A0C3NJZ7_PHLG1|nr:hypothetical protein PHLGIDRAFT_162283 [Phlebiopsis gigantea 11061_1 CR5-6]